MFSSVRQFEHAGDNSGLVDGEDVTLPGVMALFYG